MTPPDGEGWRAVTKPGFPAGLGTLWARRDEAGWECGLGLTESHLNAAGAVHGGVLMALGDHALSLAAWEAAGRQPCVTVQFGTQFLRTASPGLFLRARGRVTRLTRHLAFMRGELFTAPDSFVASVDGVWRILARA